MILARRRKNGLTSPAGLSCGRRLAAMPSIHPPELTSRRRDRLHRLGSLTRAQVSVATGVFGEMMSVELVNEGPVTILLDSEKTF